MIRIFTWLGVMVSPTMFGSGPFWPVIFSNFVDGMQFLNTLKLPSRCMDDPINRLEISPVAHPASSPFEIGVIVS